MNPSFLEHFLAGLEVAFSPNRYLTLNVAQGLNVGTFCLAGAMLCIAWFARRRGDSASSVVGWIVMACVWPTLRLGFYVGSPRYAHREIEMQAELSFALLVFSGVLLGWALRLRPRMGWLLGLGAFVGLALSVFGQVSSMRVVSLALVLIDAWLISEPLSVWLLRRYNTHRLTLPCRCCVTAMILAVSTASLVPANVVKSGIEEAIRHDPGFQWVDAVTHEPLPERPSPILSTLHRWSAEHWLFPFGVVVGLLAPRVRWRRPASHAPTAAEVLRASPTIDPLKTLLRWCGRIALVHSLVLIVVCLWPIRRAPPSYESVHVGFEAMARGDLKLAEKQFQDAMSMRPTNAWAVFGLGQLHGRLAAEAHAEWQVTKGDKARELYSRFHFEHMRAAAFNLTSSFVFLGEIVRGQGSSALMPPSFIATPWTVLPGVATLVLVNRARTGIARLLGMVGCVGASFLGRYLSMVIYDGVRSMHGL